MASITISSPSGGVNPTNTFLPYNNNGVFADSSFQQISPLNITAVGVGGVNNGLGIDNSNGSYFLGDIEGLFQNNFIYFNEDGNAEIRGQNLNIILQQPDGNISIFNDLIISNTAGLLSTYLKLSVNGTKYKIALLNDTL
jgi:hypothetical protein